MHAVKFVVGRGCVYCISLVNRFNGCLQKLNCNIFIRVSKLTGYVNVSQDKRCGVDNDFVRTKTHFTEL